MTRINTNIAAIQAQHKLAANNFDLGVRLERLSTGLRINRGRDDPAGLIASETLRSEIRGISQAIDNSSRAMNVIATAEGALNEISSLLLDIQALINHAANDGAISEEEVAADQLQVDSLIEAIDRIANTTQFGGDKLLNGNYQYQVSGVATSAISSMTLFGARVPQQSFQNVTVEVASAAQTGQLSFTGTSITENITIEVQGSEGTEVISLASGTSAANVVKAINDVSRTTGVSAVNSGGSIFLNSQTYGEDSFVSVKPIDGNFIATTGNTMIDYGEDAKVLVNGRQAAVDGLSVALRSNGLDLTMELTSDFGTTPGTQDFQIKGGGATFQIGPEVNPNGQVSIGIPSVSSSNLGNPVLGYLYSIKNGESHAINAEHTLEAEKIVKEAISQVAIIRGRLGGLQRNQIETNINSQRVALENVQAAESAIRDADIAAEVAALTRSQILVQSTTQILGIANQQPQNALSLLG